MCSVSVVFDCVARRKFIDREYLFFVVDLCAVVLPLTIYLIVLVRSAVSLNIKRASIPIFFKCEESAGSSVSR